jgi:hypothetical protein
MVEAPEEEGKETIMHKKDSFVRIAVVLALALILPAAVTHVALAKEKQTKTAGLRACSDWCKAHNKTEASRIKCVDKCVVYWNCNGSDATEQDCKEAKLLFGSAASQSLRPQTPSTHVPPTKAVPKTAPEIQLSPVPGAGLQRK